MPEGDSIAGHARRLRPVLEGRTIIEVGGSSPSLRRHADEVVGASVTGIRTVGKHLIIDLDAGYSIRVHLGMTGRWVVLDHSEKPYGMARMVLSTDAHHVVCLAAPTVEVGRTRIVNAGTARIGPDLLGDFDEGEFLRRARLLPREPVARVLLDQRVLAGIGNVYKSEVLFLEGIHPGTPVGSLTDDELVALSRRAVRLLTANVGRPRSTTGSRARNRDTWVYGRTGHPCRRCRTAIHQVEQGGRLTFWCPTCQPTPEPGAD